VPRTDAYQRVAERMTEILRTEYLMAIEQSLTETFSWCSDRMPVAPMSRPSV
jgi:hypothetical protein